VDIEITALVAIPQASGDMLLAIAGGRLMASEDGGESWSGRSAGLSGAVSTVARDPAAPGRIWAASGNRVYLSDDLGRSWGLLGEPLPEPELEVRGIAADLDLHTIVVTTHRGLYRSEDGGTSWVLKEGNLPVHIEAGPLIQVPGEPRALYAVFSLVPYPELWRTAVEGGNLLARADPVSLAGGLAFVILLLIGGGLLVGWLNRRRLGSANGIVPT
jgi:photosystem II stability/assembly factor-like uncharacterized protein